MHGEAIATASTPDPKAFAWRLACDQVATRDGTSAPNSNMPDKFNAMTKNRIARAVTTAGDWSWKPQPSCAPAARSATITAPRTKNVITTPAENARPSWRNTRRSSPPEVASRSAFSDRTGNTQGIRFSRMPPANAKTSANGSPRFALSAPAGAEKSIAASATTGFGPAVGAPVSGRSSAIACTVASRSCAIACTAASRSFANPRLAVNTPRSRVNAPDIWCEIGSDNT